jgi:hypothetical protein
MQNFTTGWLKSASFSGILVVGLVTSACSTSDDPADTPVNIPPVANNDAFTVDEAMTATPDLAANDTDADDGLDLATIIVVASPANGFVSVNADGTVDYTHDGSETLTDTFTYTIKDNSAAVSNTATVTITVTAAPTPPAAVQAGIYKSTVVEGADDLEFVISLAAASTGTVSIDYTTVDGTAVAGIDYSAANGTVQFAPGEVRKFISVAVLNNPVAAAGTSKNMQLVLSNPQNAVLSVDTGTGTIVDSGAMSTDSAFIPDWGTAGVFSDAVTCANCHESDAIMQYPNPEVSLSTNNISPSSQWKHSVMAQAFNDPYWQAAVQDEAESFPALTGLIEDTCTTCHAPMGHKHAHQTNTDLDVDGYFRFDTANAQNHSREGVSCTLCHQMQESDADSGKYVISDTTKIIYGPYDTPFSNRMFRDTRYTPVYGMHIEKSELCSNCHTLYTPAIDPDTGLPSGPDTGLPSATKGFLEQGPYLEWQNSVYASAAQPIHCQDCHMPVPSETYQTPISTTPDNSPNRAPYGQHTLVGGNAHLLEILRDYRTELGIAGSTTVSGFDDQIVLTKNFLGGAASVAVSTFAVAGTSLNFDIDITNHAGHKVPSAYPSRRMWLHVTVRNGAKQIIFESGKYDSRGYISTDEARLKADCMSKDKLDGFDSSVCYEPHRDVINDSSQVAIYETVLGDINGDITHTLLQGAQYLKDNRIPPAGFTNSKAATIELQTVPSGVSADNDFNCVNATEGCGKDSVHYQVDINGQTGPYAVEVELLYQATQPAFVDGMHTDGDRVNRFKVMYDAVPPSVEVLATATRP